MKNLKLVLFLLITASITYQCGNSTQTTNDEQITEEVTESNQTKAEKAVSEWIKENANDPSSYEIVEFDSLEERLGKEGELEIELELLALELEAGLGDEAAQTKIDSLNDVKKNLKESITGYAIAHKFRSKNSFGALVIERLFFLLDKDFKVTGTKTPMEMATDDLDEWADEMNEALEELE